MTPRKRKRSKELVHGLSRTVELKDWDFAMIQAALKYYAKNHPSRRGYIKTLMAKLRTPFVDLVKETKRQHHRIRSSLGSDTLDTVIESN